jgi:hypothetical protein
MYMGKKIIYGLLLFSSTLLFSQEKTSLENNSKNETQPIKIEIVKNNSFEEADPYGKNEITLNLFSLIAFQSFNISYERILNASNGVGVSLLINGNKSDINSDGIKPKFSISPYYRMYFLNRKDYGSSGFFIEVNSSITSLENDQSKNLLNEIFSLETVDEVEQITAVSFGAGLGQKWINKKGLSLEVSAGFGTYLFNNDLEGTGKFGITIGKRF